MTVRVHGRFAAMSVDAGRTWSCTASDRLMSFTVDSSWKNGDESRYLVMLPRGDCACYSRLIRGCRILSGLRGKAWTVSFGMKKTLLPMLWELGCANRQTS